MADPMLFRQHTLASGLTVYFQRRDIAIVGCHLVVGVGERHDPIGKEEIAHLLEHHLTTGTHGLPKMGLMQLERWVARQGFTFDLGATSLEATTFGGQSPAGKMEKLLEFMSAYVLHPRLDGDLDHDKEIVKNERLSSTSPVRIDAKRAMRSAVFGRHRLAAAGIWGDDETIDGITPSDVRDFHHRFYQTPNMTLIVAGGADEDAVLKAAERLFPPPPTGFERPPHPEPIRFRTPRPRTFMHRERKAASTSIEYAWHMPPVDCDVLRILSGAMTHLLTDRVRERAEATYDISADWDARKDHCAFTIETEVSPQDAGRVRRIILNTIRDADAVVAEIPDVKRDLDIELHSLELNVEETLERAADRASNGLPPRPIEEAAARIMAVTDDDVRALLREHVNADRHFAVVIEEC